MKKKSCLLGGAFVASVVLMVALFVTSCKPGKTNVIVECVNPVSEALLPFLDSYTSGIIGKGEPVMVRFKNADDLKLKYGEAIPSKSFAFTPELKGKAVWVDDRTVCFEYDNIDDRKQYACAFDISEFVDVSSDERLEFAFGVRRQNITLVSAVPVCESKDVMGYQLSLAFSNDLEMEEAMSVFGEEFKAKYNPEMTDAGNGFFDVKISGLKRGESESKIQLVLDGTPLDCKTKIVRDLAVYAQNDFSAIRFDVEKGAGRATLYFTQPLKASQNLDGFVKFDPEIGYRYDIKGNKVIFYFDKSSKYYYQLREMTMTVESGIRSSDGKVLQEGASYEFDLTNDEPKVRWTSEGTIIPNIDDATVYFDAVCLNSVTLRIIRIYDGNILSFLQENDLDETYGVRKAGRLEKKVRLELDNMSPTQWKTYPINISDYVKAEPGAMYQLSIDFGPQDYSFATEEMKSLGGESMKIEEDYWDGERYDYKEYSYDGDWGDPMGAYFYNYVEKKKNIMITDLAVTAKMGRNDLIDVYVYRISDASPVAGAEVKAYNYQCQELASAKTDGQGHVSLVCGNRPAFVVAQDNRGSKSVIRTSNSNALSYSKFDIGGESVEKGVSGFVYTNRGVWRPGDELQLNLMLSDFDDQIPDNYPVVMEIYDANSRLYAKRVNSKAVGGIYCFSVATNPSDETGLWSARFKVGNSVITKMLRVETVKPNRLEINMDFPELIKVASRSHMKLHSKWLNGLKANGLKAEVDVRLRSTNTVFEKFSSYTFTNETEEFSDEELTVFSGPLDASGCAEVGFSPLGDLSSTQMLNAVMTVKVFEPSGDFSVASASAKVSPIENYIGVELPASNAKYGDFYDTDKNWSFNVAFVNENGVLNQATTALEYALYKLDSYWWWSSEDVYSLQRYASGTYRRPVKTGTLSCNGKTSLTLNIPKNEWGNYLLVIDEPIGGARFAKVICFDWGTSYMHSSSEAGAPVRLSMKAVKDKCAVGDEVVVTFPANKSAKALVTVEANEKVLQSMYLDNLETEGKVVFKATEEMVPNVYVYVSLIQPHDAANDMPVRMYGVVPVKIEDKSLELKPVLKAPAESNTNKKVSVKVSEEKGKAMAYTLAVVDEGILGLTSFKTPDPYRYFNSKQALEVRTWDNYASIIDAFSGELGSVYAIGGDDFFNQEITLDNRFKAFSVTYGPFELKAGGTNVHEIEVPQSSGALRFMVVAKSGEKSFGAAEKQMKVIDPITLYAAAPRVVAPGDELTMKVQVLSPVFKGKTLNVKVDNKNLLPVGGLPTAVQIDGNGEGMIAVKVKVAETIGNAVLNVTVSGHNYEAVSKTEMPIRMPYAEKRNTVTKEIDAHQTVSVPLAVPGMQGTQSGSVAVSSLIPVDFFGRLEYLKSYPHGCLEQVTSKAFPLLYLNYFVQQDEQSVAELKSTVEGVINDLRSYQKSDNSMTNWMGGSYCDPWTEIYALHFLVEAKKQGFDVPDYFVDGLKKYQAARAKQWRNNPDFPQGETIQAYRLFVLALANAAETGSMNRLRENKLQYSLTKSLLAASFAQVGKTSVTQKILEQITGAEAKSDYKVTFGSEIRDLAFTIYAQMLCGVDRTVVQNNVNELCGMLNSRSWLDTQSSAFALFALGKYAEMNQLNASNLSATVMVNGQEMNLNGNLSTLSKSFVPAIGDNKIEIKNNSDQKIVANVFAKSYVAEYETKESGNYIKMAVAYMDKNGDAVNLSKLALGTDFSVNVMVENPSNYSVTELALSYYLPSGWEIVNDRLNGFSDEMQEAKHLDIRDDRAYFYFDLMPKEKKTFKLKLNATYEGNYMVPAVHCEDMYNDQIYYVIPARGTVVK